MPTFFFLLLYHRTSRDLLSHLWITCQSHDRSHDLSHDIGHMISHMTMDFLSLHMSHYDSSLVFHLFLAYDSHYLISDSHGKGHVTMTSYLLLTQLITRIHMCSMT